jgi:hypothetical protein
MPGLRRQLHTGLLAVPAPSRARTDGDRRGNDSQRADTRSSAWHGSLHEMLVSPGFVGATEGWRVDKVAGRGHGG